MPKGSTCAEIGVWKGDFSAQILDVVRPAKLHLIDPWLFFHDPVYKRAWYGGSAASSQGDMDRIYQDVLGRFAQQIKGGTVVVHRLTSAEAADLFPTGHFEWIYIDGNHRYEFVRDDLASFYPKVKPGGVAAGDDYGLEGWWGDGVTRAVDEFVRETGTYLDVLEHQFVIRKNA